MSFESLLIDTVTVFNPEDSEDADRYGNEVDGFDEGTDVDARVQQDDREELLTDRDTRITSHLVFLPAGTIISALSEVEWAGERYTVDGEPERLNGRSTEHHVECYIKRTEG